MPNRRFAGAAGTVFHVMNRGVRRLALFNAPGDYESFLRCLRETRSRVPIRLLCYCVMPNHFHLVVWPTEDRQVSDFMRLLLVTHAKRWHGFRGTTGTGAVYQGRFKAFPVQTDSHFLTVCRYVEANPLRAGLVSHAEDWRWSSLHAVLENCEDLAVDRWPVCRPSDWVDLVNTPAPHAANRQVRRSVARGAPYGAPEWSASVSKALGIESATVERGRPRKKTSGVFLRKP